MKPNLKPLGRPASMDNIGNDWKDLDRNIKKSIETFTKLSHAVEKIGDDAGNSDALKDAVRRIEEALSAGRDLTTVIDSALYIRALSAVVVKLGRKAPLSQKLLNHIDTIKEKPSVILLENLRQHYLMHYDQLPYRAELESWILSALKKRDQIKQLSTIIFSSTGAKWLADSCISEGRDFDSAVNNLGLNKYQSGRFITVSQQIYFVEQLKTIPENKPHTLLKEMQKESVYNAPYGEQGLLGHEILKTLIRRAPTNGVDDSWRNVVMQIAGDPRISKSDQRYQKWWLHLDQSMINKVNGWLSGLDLKLFLEALENYSEESGDDELLRMYPARKRFLQGLLEKELVTGTRLYLTYGFRRYLNEHYEPEHLPKLYTVTPNKTSILHVQVGSAHLIEGSHNCKLWVYRGLSEQAVVFNYSKKNVSYSDLTSSLADQMRDEYGQDLLVDKMHHDLHLNWQKKAIAALKVAGTLVNPKDVLTEPDYSMYKRKFGVA